LIFFKPCNQDNGKRYQKRPWRSKKTQLFIIAQKCADEIGWQHVFLNEKYSFSAPLSAKFSQNIIHNRYRFIFLRRMLTCEHCCRIKEDQISKVHPRN